MKVTIIPVVVLLVFEAVGCEPQRGKVASHTDPPPTRLVTPACEPPGDTYEQTLRFFRDLPFPRLEKLMDRNGLGVTRAWVCESPNKKVAFDPHTVDEGAYDAVVEFHTDVFLVPTGNDIRKRIHRTDGKTVCRSARITALGQLIWDETLIDNVRDGLAHGWYLNGQLASRDDYLAGSVDGLSVAYSPDGKLLQKIQWQNGRCSAAWKQVGGKWIQTVKDGEGWTTSYDWYFGDGKEGGSDHFSGGVNDRSVG